MGRFPVLTSVLVLLVPAQAARGQGVVTGTVRQDSSLLVLPNVRVVLEELDRKTNTSETGRYRFENIPAGTYTLLFQLAGYGQIFRSVVVRDRLTIVLDASLPSAAPAPAPRPERGPALPIPEPWNLVVSFGWVFHGPVTAMREYLSDLGWSSNGQESGVAFSGTFSRDLSRRLRLGGIFAISTLGDVRGVHGDYEFSASWNSLVIGPGAWVTLHPLVSLGGGPLLGVITTSSAPPTGRNSIVPGFFTAVAIRSSNSKGTFLEGSLTYRVLASHEEGPWAVRNTRVASIVDPGFGPPSGQIATGHAVLNVGFGWRF